MKLEKQVCSFMQAKKLSDLGLKAVTYFYWVKGENEEPTLIPCPANPETIRKKIYPAPTVAELGILLPAEITYEDEDLYLQGTMGNRPGEFYYIWFQFATDNAEWELFPAIEEDTEAEARAEALIWLMENGIVKPENLNL
jgi:hypothetical protein